jgi:hypothetical protein
LRLAHHSTTLVNEGIKAVGSASMLARQRHVMHAA